MDSIIDNLESCCRTCLKEVSNEDHDIFGDTDCGYDSVTLLQMLTECTPIQVEMADLMPKKLCDHCYDRLRTCYEFRKLIVQVDSKLQEIIKDTKVKKDVEKTLLLDDNNIEVKSVSNIKDLTEYELGTIKVEPEQVENADSLDEFADNFPLRDFNEEELKPKAKCEVCHKKFKSASLLQKHLEKHKNTKNIKKFNCAYCRKSFKQHFSYVRHLSTHGQMVPEVNHNVTEHTENLICKICFEKFHSSNSLAAHMRVHTKKGRILSCSICGKVFSKISHLKRHELSHDENRPFQCTFCPKKFNTEGLLSEHTAKHVTIKPHICPLCAKAFVHVSTLATHIKLHTREKQFLCPTCGKKFDSSTNLKQHTMRHLGVKNFACSYCPMRFVSKGELQSHVRTHTGERPWRCEQCGAAFGKRAALRVHRARHAALRPHACDACPRRFVTRDHLKRHYRTHTGEKPYKCAAPACERAFTQTNDLVKHRRLHHGDHVYRCSECAASFRLAGELRRHVELHYAARGGEGGAGGITTACPRKVLAGAGARARAVTDELILASGHVESEQ